MYNIFTPNSYQNTKRKGDLSILFRGFPLEMPHHNPVKVVTPYKGCYTHFPDDEAEAQS